MEHEYYIKKWLNGELTGDELKAFEQTDTYASLVKLSERSNGFAPETYETEAELEKLLTKIKNKGKVRTLDRFRPFITAAAAVAVIAMLYFVVFNNTDTFIETQVAEKTEVSLPDASNVTLNALSSLSFNEKEWKTNREVSLDGEAYFKVAKGARFDVKTSAGTISVLGTQFNVKNREGHFEVVCYEGLVSVTHNDTTIKLPAKNSFVVIDGKITGSNSVVANMPSWTQNESTFKSIPFGMVLSEFERQYGVSVEAKGVDTDVLFTGRFVHDNMDLAIKSIALPLKLNFKKVDEKQIVLSLEDK